MIKQLMIQPNNTTKSEKYHQDKWWLHSRLFIRFAHFEKNYKLIAVDLSKQKALGAGSRAIQQIIFTGKIKATEANTKVIIYYILEKSKKNNTTIF